MRNVRLEKPYKQSKKIPIRKLFIRLDMVIGALGNNESIYQSVTSILDQISSASNGISVLDSCVALSRNLTSCITIGRLR